jgi:CheY-like chemotaxis protein
VEDRALRVLLVEDDPVDVMNVQRAFRRSHVLNPLLVAPNGAEALELLRGGRVPTARLLVLLDLHMPRMGGVELLREMRRDPALARLPVVVLTTSEEERERVESHQLDVAGYIVKPVTFLNFTETVATVNRYWELVELPPPSPAIEPSQTGDSALPNARPSNA